MKWRRSEQWCFGWGAQLYWMMKEEKLLIHKKIVKKCANNLAKNVLKSIHHVKKDT